MFYYTMQLTTVLLASSSLYLLVIMPNVTCREERIKIEPNPEKDKKVNPYITKFHDAANSRPSKCQGKC